MEENPASYRQAELTSSQHTAEVFAHPCLFCRYSQQCGNKTSLHT